MKDTMKALVFVAPGKIELREKRIPRPGPTEALIRITLTTICGTDIHIFKGEYPVQSGLTLGHEPVGVIEQLGSEVKGYKLGQRVIVGAITPCGQCESCLSGIHSQCGGKAMGGWRFGNTIDGAQAEYLLVPDAAANLAVIPDGLTDEQVLMCPDIMSTGFSGAGTIFGVDSVEKRLSISNQFGATTTINYRDQDPVQAILELTHGRGVDVAIEALGTQPTFESCLRVIKPGGTLSSLGVYSKGITVPLDAFSAGLGDNKIVTTLCPGGKDRMRRLMNVIATKRFDTQPLITHSFKLEEIVKAYELFASQKDGVLKVAIYP